MAAEFDLDRNVGEREPGGVAKVEGEVGLADLLDGITGGGPPGGIRFPSREVTSLGKLESGDSLAWLLRVRRQVRWSGPRDRDGC